MNHWIIPIINCSWLKSPSSTHALIILRILKILSQQTIEIILYNSIIFSLPLRDCYTSNLSSKISSYLLSELRLSIIPLFISLFEVGLGEGNRGSSVSRKVWSSTELIMLDKREHGVSRHGLVFTSIINMHWVKNITQILWW